MRHFVPISLLIAVTSVLCLTAYSQTPKTPDQQQRDDWLRLEADLQKRAEAMNRLYNEPRVRNTSKQDSEDAKAWVKAREMLLQLLKPDPADIAKYKPFLAAGNGGLFRLFPDYDCVTEFLIRSDGQCAGFIDGGTAYSFRTNRNFLNRGAYSLDPYADIRFNRNRIVSKGFLEHGVIVLLGDIPIENVGLSDPGLKFLVNLNPAATRREANEFELRLDKGITSGTYEYSNSIEPHENTTYAMRIIAYCIRGIDFNGELTKAGFKYFRLSYDKRVDLTIVFRVVRRDPNGALTILWKELKRKKAPSIRF